MSGKVLFCGWSQLSWHIVWDRKKKIFLQICSGCFKRYANPVQDCLGSVMPICRPAQLSVLLCLKDLKSTAVYSASTRCLWLSVAPCCRHWSAVWSSSFRAPVRTELHKQTHTCLSGSTPNDAANKRVFLTSALGQIVWCVRHQYWGIFRKISFIQMSSTVGFAYRWLCTSYKSLPYEASVFIYSYLQYF